MNRIRTVAVGFDGSSDAEHALGWAARLAETLGAELVVVHATGLLEHASRPAAVAELERTARRLARDEGVEEQRCHWHPIDGDPASTLLRCTAAPIGADLVVVGTRGSGGHSETLLGSTSHELAEHASCPVVIVPRADQVPSADPA